MAIKIKLKNSVTQDAVPTGTHLPEVGELAVNANINSIGGYMRASDNSIVKIFGPGSVSTPTASTTVAGIAELATSAETTTGTDAARVTTPAGVKAVTDAERTTSNSTYLALAGGTLSGVLQATAGSSSAASIHFGDTDSGIYGGTNTVSLTAGGTQGLTLNSSAYVNVPTRLGIGGIPNALFDIQTPAGQTDLDCLTIANASTGMFKITCSDTDAGNPTWGIKTYASEPLTYSQGGSEKLRVDNSGRLLVGSSSDGAPLSYGSKLQVNSTGSDGSIVLGRHAASTSAPVFIFQKSRATAVNGNTTVQSGDNLGFIRFHGADGTDRDSIAGEIYCKTEGTVAGNRMPGSLVFGTTANSAGSVSPTAALTLDSSQNAIFGNRIGLGTTNPSYAVQIQGAGNANAGLYLYNNTGGEGIRIVPESNGHCRIYSSTNDDLNLGTNGVDRFSIASDGSKQYFAGGNLGLGTASPTKPSSSNNSTRFMEIASGDGADLVLSNNQSAFIGGGAHIGSLAFKNIDDSAGSAPHYAGIRCESADTAGNMDLRFYTGITNLEADTPQVYLDVAGRPQLRAGGIGKQLQIYGSGNTSDADADNLIVSNWGDSSGDYWQIGSNLALNTSGNNEKQATTLKGAAVNIDGRAGRIFLKTSPANSSTVYETFSMTSDGNIGFNDTSPQRKLHVTGGVHFGWAGTNGGAPYIGTTPALSVSTEGNNGGADIFAGNALVHFGRGGGGPGAAGVTTSLFRVNLGGNVGIGCNPTANLDIREDYGSAQLILGSANAGGAILVLDGDSNGDSSGGDYAYIQHDTAGDLNIVCQNPAGNGNIFLKSNGGSYQAVGCHEAGSVELRYQNSTRLSTTSAGGDLTGGWIADYSASSSTTPLTVRNNTGHAASDCRLSIRTYSNYGGDPYIHLDSGGTNFIVGQRWMGTTNNYMVLGPGESPGTGVTGGIYIQGNGKIGMNTSGGSYRLNISDTSTSPVWTYTNSAGYYNFIAQSNTNTGTQYYFAARRLDGSQDGYLVSSTDGVITLANGSDYRLKDNIVSMSNGIDIVKKLNPITYKWKASTGRDTSVTMQGFFAHEVDEAGVIGAVDGPKDGVWDTAENPVEAAVGDPRYQGLSLERLVPALTAALKEAIVKIETLETKVAALEAS